MSYKMSKDYKRDWLKERHQRKYWEEKYKELEATIKDDNKDLKMSEAKEDYDKAMANLHKAHDELVEQLEQCQAALKECQEECHKKDEEIAALKRELQGVQLAPGKPKRQVADESIDNSPPSGFTDNEEEPEERGDDEEKVGDVKPKGAESKEEEDTSDGTSEGTSSGTSGDEEEESYLEKLRF